MRPLGRLAGMTMLIGACSGTLGTTDASADAAARAAVIVRMDAYAAAGRAVDADAISALARADTVEVFGNTMLVWGTYFERLRFSGQPESAQYGRFVMEWRRETDGVWRIARYYRIPLPANWSETP